MGIALRDTRIAVVEDDQDSAELLGALLERAGAEVGHAGNGADALRLLETFVPDLLVLDIGLPDMDGYELLRRIRENPALVTTPPVAATAHAFARDRERARAVGFAVHTAKPFDPEALIHLLSGFAASAREAAAPASSAADRGAFAQIAAILKARGLAESLKALNGRTAHRYTGLFRYDGDMLRNIALADEQDPQVIKGADARLETAFCALLERDRGSFAVVDGASDPRVAGLPVQPDIRSYCGALVRNADGTPFGSLCHFDHGPHVVPLAELALLERVAPLIARSVAIEIF